MSGLSTCRCPVGSYDRGNTVHEPYCPLYTTEPQATSDPVVGSVQEQAEARLASYAQESLKWTHGRKTEDELLQRIWNLAGDVVNLSDRVRVLVDALRERFVTDSGGCRLCDNYWETPTGLECACGMLALAASSERESEA